MFGRDCNPVHRSTCVRASVSLQAVGINNLDGEMNVFSPSFRRAVATDLVDIKSSAPPGLWAGDDVSVQTALYTYVSPRFFSCALVCIFCFSALLLHSSSC